jgi:hypothetical protein
MSAVIVTTAAIAFRQLRSAQRMADHSNPENDRALQPGGTMTSAWVELRGL